MIPSGSSSGSPPWTRSPTAARKSCWAGARSSNPSRCSDWTWPTTRSCSRRSWSCSTRCGRRSRCTGKAAPRPALHGLSVYPPLEHHLLPTWIGVGGTTESVLRCAQYGYPIIFAIIGGQPRRFRPLADLYRRGHGQVRAPTAAGGHALTGPRGRAPTSRPGRSSTRTGSPLRNRLGAERGWGPAGGASSTPCCAPDGALYVGSPETVAAQDRPG